MTENVENAMFEILKRIQADLAVLKTDMVEVKGRLDRLESAMKRQRRDSAAMLVIMRSTVGDFNERVKDLEDEIRILRERD